jgi:hypothetical protein
MSIPLKIGAFEARQGTCSACRKDDFVATDDYYDNCAECLRKVADALDLLKKTQEDFKPTS